jgi:hypothetical protein
MSPSFEQNLTTELKYVRLYLEQGNQSKVLRAVRQVLRMLEAPPSAVRLEPVVLEYLALLNYFLRTFGESSFALEKPAVSDQQGSPESLAYLYSSIPAFLNYLNGYSFIEWDNSVGTSTYYPEQSRLITKDSREIPLTRLENLLFRSLLRSKNNVIPYQFFLDGDQPLFRSDERFRAILKRLRNSIRPLESEIKITAIYGVGIYLYISETE